MAVITVPKIFDWIENAPINENLPKEKPVEETTTADEDIDSSDSTADDTADSTAADDELFNNYFDF